MSYPYFTGLDDNIIIIIYYYYIIMILKYQIIVGYRYCNVYIIILCRYNVVRC